MHDRDGSSALSQGGTSVPDEEWDRFRPHRLLEEVLDIYLVRVDERYGPGRPLPAQDGGVEAGRDEEVPGPAERLLHLRLAHPAGRPWCGQVDTPIPSLQRAAREPLNRLSGVGARFPVSCAGGWSWAPDRENDPLLLFSRFRSSEVRLVGDVVETRGRITFREGERGAVHVSTDVTYVHPAVRAAACSDQVARTIVRREVVVSWNDPAKVLVEPGTVSLGSYKVDTTDGGCDTPTGYLTPDFRSSG